MSKTRATLAAAIAAAALAGFTASSASAACVAGVCTDTQVVNGTPLSTLALGVPAPSPFVFASFGPGVNASGLGTVLVTSTAAWSLSAADASNPGGVTAGHMYKTGALCPAGAENETSNALTVSGAGTGALGTVGHAITVNGTAQQIANGAVTDTVTNTIGMSVGSGETMGTGCIYTATLTYTVQ